MPVPMRDDQELEHVQDEELVGLGRICLWIYLWVLVVSLLVIGIILVRSE